MCVRGSQVFLQVTVTHTLKHTLRDGRSAQSVYRRLRKLVSDEEKKEEEEDDDAGT